MRKHLGALGLYDRFATVVTRNDVTHGKPAPDIYLEAARRLAVPPPNCVALEDSSPGLTAAHAAGTMAIMVPDIVQPTDEVRAKCLHVAPDPACRFAGPARGGYAAVTLLKRVGKGKGRSRPVALSTARWRENACWKT